MPDLVSLAVGIAAHRRINTLKSDMRARTILKGQSKCAYCGEGVKDDSLFRHNGK